MSRIRVLIADDDTMVRIGLKTIIDWEKNGFVLVGEAQNGVQALELAEKWQPDIIITDIKMPGMDGIALIRELKRRKCPAKILVLSSYDDFDLVKQAIKLGADDYLLKLNLEPQELIAALDESARTLELHDKEEFVSDRHTQRLLRQHFLKDIVSNFYISEEQLRRSMQEMGVFLDGENVVCLILKAGELYRFEDASEEQCHTLCFSVINIAEEIMSDQFQAYCFVGKTGEFYILACPKSDPLDRKLVRHTAQRLRGLLMEYLNISCTIGIGIGACGIEGIRTALQQASDAIHFRFYLSSGGIVEWDAAVPPRINEAGYPMHEVREQLGDALSKGDYMQTEALLSEMLHDMKNLCLSRDAIGSAAVELLCILQEYFENYGLPLKHVLPTSMWPYKDLLHMETILQTEQFFQLLIQDLKLFLQREQEKGIPAAVTQVQQILKHRYAEELTLQEVAAEVCLNPSYLSSLLKKHTGRTFTD